MSTCSIKCILIVCVCLSKWGSSSDLGAAGRAARASWAGMCIMGAPWPDHNSSVLGHSSPTSVHWRHSRESVLCTFWQLQTRQGILDGILISHHLTVQAWDIFQNIYIFLILREYIGQNIESFFLICLAAVYVCIVCRVQHLWSSQFRPSWQLTLMWCNWDIWRVICWFLLLAAAISVTLKGKSFGEWGIRSVMENMELVFCRSSRADRGHQAQALPISCTVLGQVRAFGRQTSVERCLAPISLNKCLPVLLCLSSLASMWLSVCNSVCWLLKNRILHVQYHKYLPPLDFFQFCLFVTLYVFSSLYERQDKTRRTWGERETVFKLSFHLMNGKGCATFIYKKSNCPTKN